MSSGNEIDTTKLALNQSISRWAEAFGKAEAPEMRVRFYSTGPSDDQRVKIVMTMTDGGEPMSAFETLRHEIRCAKGETVDDVAGLPEKWWARVTAAAVARRETLIAEYDLDAFGRKT